MDLEDGADSGSSDEDDDDSDVSDLSDLPEVRAACCRLSRNAIYLGHSFLESTTTSRCRFLPCTFHLFLLEKVEQYVPRARYVDKSSSVERLVTLWFSIKE